MNKLKFLMPILVALVLLTPGLALFSHDAYATHGGPHDPTTGFPIVSSQCGSPNQPPCTSVNSIEGIIGLIQKVFGYFFMIVVILTSIMLVYAAFLYIWSKGDTSKIENARMLIVYSVIALIVAGLAYVIPTIVSNFIK